MCSAQMFGSRKKKGENPPIPKVIGEIKCNSIHTSILFGFSSRERKLCGVFRREVEVVVAFSLSRSLSCPLLSSVGKSSVLISSLSFVFHKASLTAIAFILAPS